MANTSKISGSGENREIEWQFTIEDPDAIKEKLVKLGAIKKGLFMMPIIVYNTANQNSNEPYVRVRHEGSKLTFTVKKDLSAEFPIEYEVALDPTKDNLENLNNMLLTMGNTIKYRVDKIREIWQLPGIKEVVFDTYPGVPTYMEIEAYDEIKLNDVTKKLGLKSEQRLLTKDIYNYFYGIPSDRKPPLGAYLTFDENAKDQFKGKFQKDESEFDRILQSQLNFVKNNF